MSICDKCIHDEVCGLEDNHEEGIVSCADRIPKDVLDEIREEISDFEEEVFHRPNTDYSDYAAVRHCLEIIDKYRGEQP